MPWRSAKANGLESAVSLPKDLRLWLADQPGTDRGWDVNPPPCAWSADEIHRANPVEMKWA